MRNVSLSDVSSHVANFLKLLVSRFVANNSLQNAAALTFTTLLSLVPLIAVSLAVFSVFPIADKVSLTIQDFVFKNFVPAAGDVLQTYLDEFSGKAARMTGTGFIFLIIVAVMLMASIDQAFNRIWRVKRKRPLLKKFIIYWAVISLGPITMALSIAVTSYIISLPMLTDSEVLKPVNKLLVFAPVLVSAFAFTLLYALIPNRPVPIKHAFAGGLLAAVLFEIAKRGFGFYVTSFPAYEAIYGALAAVPIFLVWLYLSWLVTFLGAEFTYCLSIYQYQKQEDNYEGDKMLDVLELLAHLWQAQQKGHSLSLNVLTENVDQYTEEHIENLLIKLQKARLVFVTDRYEWALSRDLSHISLWELYQQMPLILPDEAEIKDFDSLFSANITAIMQKIVQSQQEHMEMPLDRLFLEASVKS